MKGKTIVCRCEDVTLHDVEHSIEVGYADIEEVKRFTGFGTGPCQGKECLARVAGLIARCTGRPPSDIRPFTSRQPVAPTELAWFAQIDDKALAGSFDDVRVDDPYAVGAKARPPAQSDDGHPSESRPSESRPGESQPGESRPEER